MAGRHGLANMAGVPRRSQDGPWWRLFKPAYCATWVGMEEGLRRLRRGPQSTGDGLFSTEARAPSIVGAAAFHFRVRDGNGWGHRALATGKMSVAVVSGE